MTSLKELTPDTPYFLTTAVPPLVASAGAAPSASNCTPPYSNVLDVITGVSNLSHSNLNNTGSLTVIHTSGNLVSAVLTSAT